LRAKATGHKGASHAELSDLYDCLGARGFEVGARTTAAGVWCSAQHRCRHRKFTETDQLPGWRVQQVHSRGLTEPENQIVLLTDAVANSSTYAVAFHTALALQQGVNSEETDAIRERRVPTDKRFAALSTLAKTLIEKRGHLSEQELDSFVAAGFTKEQVLEVIAIVAASTITNYAGTIANPPLEDPFRQYAWRG
jgi:hypothetical protein